MHLYAFFFLIASTFKFGLLFSLLYSCILSLLFKEWRKKRMRQIKVEKETKKVMVFLRYRNRNAKVSLSKFK